MNPAWLCGLRNVELIQLFPYNSTDYRCKVRVLQLWGPGTPKSIIAIKYRGVKCLCLFLLIQCPSAPVNLVGCCLELAITFIDIVGALSQMVLANLIYLSKRLF